MNHLLILTLLFRLWFSFTPLSAAPASDGVVRAVLFYSPSCGHCEYVITTVMPPLFEEYGEQLYIVGIDVSQVNGQALFMASLQYFNLEQSGVPFLVVGDTYLVGSRDIPEQFPTLIQQHLAQGGVDWPAIPGMAEAMAAVEDAEAEDPAAPTEAKPTTAALVVTSAPTPVPGMLVTGEETSALGANFSRDWLGNSLAVLVLLGMIYTVGKAFLYLRQMPASKSTIPWKWAIPVLCLIGFGVAGYLAYVETTLVEAYCGPVGDCNTVQQSEYARLFGVLPIGILGLIGYVLILVTWAVGQAKNPRLAAYAALAQLGFTSFGVLFSIYLTFLEPCVIGATCAWCLTSAILMTVLLWLSLPAARRAWYQLKSS